ncbi:Protein arginine N-methyltransferase [Quillaja saponaria]|uniref:Protein arginine N-methyltransferase n=1 Tax=Quillaja saponaria TaxID=32244 RepID=A0AAD7KS70_QUISA|nr:Protein arginine N-methyltransferase [Quillaja saponaria]
MRPTSMASVIHKTLKATSLLQLLTRLTHTQQSFALFTATAAQSMDPGTTQRVFQLKLDPLTGNSEWVVIEEEEEEGFSQNYQKPLLATTSYLDMLNDSRRNRAFREAIDKTITKPCHVLDIGAGTGLLSMMAARAMGSGDSTRDTGSKGIITACESYLPMAKLMKKVLRLNGMERKINVIIKRSDELKVGTDIPSRADVLVSEILDSELLGEGLIPTLQHAHDMLLVEDPLTVPYRATTYGQLVESTFLWKLHDLHNNEAKASDGIRLVSPGLNTNLRIKSQQYAMHCDAIREEIKLLSEPFKIFEFDFWKRPDSHGENEMCIKATDDGKVHAVVSWWTLQLDRDGTIFYSTAPRWINSSLARNSSDAAQGSVDWCDHWKQCVWFVPGKGMSVFKDEEVHLHAVHTETSISYNLKNQVPSSENIHYGSCAGDLELKLSPERIAVYGDREWRVSILTAIGNALQERVNSLCMVADDSVFLPLLVAHLSEKSHVISLFPGLRQKGIKDTHQKQVDLLIGEPFYYGNEGMLPWQNLRFWKDRTMLDSLLSRDALLIPCKGILKACAMSLPGPVDIYLHRKRFPCLPFFVWQCGEFKELSEIFTVMEFDFSELIRLRHGKVQVKFSQPGICHGFALWIDWVMDSENSIMVSTGPDKRYWKQGVRLLPTPITVGTYGSRNVGECCSAVLEASFDPSNGELIVVPNFS